MDNIYKTMGKNIHGINVYVNSDALEGDNKKFEKLYNNIAPFYHLSQKLFYKIKFNGEYNFRNEFLKDIIIKDFDTVLETSIGTADNLFYLNKKAKYYGVDISIKMLGKALRHIKRLNIDAELSCCEAENLPFCDNVFDVVYSCGGINYYNNKEKAIFEMIRVAKNGTRIFIIDETDKTVKNIYKNIHGKRLYEIEKASLPLNLIPKEMENIESKIICNGYMYIIAFNKPKE
jgi:ubiquinone/menaquinone biosynthesis C-methylase UbiE